MTFSVDGPIANNPGRFSVDDIDIYNAYNVSVLPAIYSVIRELTYGPAAAYFSSDYPLTLNEAEKIIKKQLNGIPSSIVTAKLTKLIFHEGFQAHFTKESLAELPNPYTNLRELQGHKNTYYTGSLTRFAGTYLVWDQSKKIVDQFFSSKEIKSI